MRSRFGQPQISEAVGGGGDVVPAIVHGGLGERLTFCEAEVGPVILGDVGQEVLDLKVERTAVLRNAELAQRGTPVGMPVERHVPTGIADVDHRAHNLEIGTHQVDDDAEGVRMVDKRMIQSTVCPVERL